MIKRKRRPRLTDREIVATVENLINIMKEGNKQGQACKRLNLSPKTCNNYKKKYEIITGQKVLNKYVSGITEKEAIKKLIEVQAYRREGMHITDSCKKAGVSVKFVYDNRELYE
jgi:transposase